MKRVLVSGLVNIETSVRVNQFPVEYSPIEYAFFGVNTSISGVAYNITGALRALGDQVTLSSYLGNDLYRDVILERITKLGVENRYIKTELRETPTSVNLYDQQGRRKIYCDLKEIQEQVYPAAELETAIQNVDGLVLCNINFNDELVRRAGGYGKPVFSDVHVLSDLYDGYNARFMRAADVLFLSDEGIWGDYGEFLWRIYHEYHNDVIVLGCGEKGAMLLDGKEQKIHWVDAVYTRPVVNTCGAGDALFSCFVHEYLHGKPPLECLRRAVVFASYKIGASGGAEGFMDAQMLEDWEKFRS